MKARLLSLLVAPWALAVVGCATSPEPLAEPPTKAEAPPVQAKETPKPENDVEQILASTPKEGDEVAVLDTARGKIVLMFFPQVAPNHVENFKKLAKKKFYDGTAFHRVIPGFMIQGGDPNTKGKDRNSWGMGGPGYQIDAEFNEVPHERGILSAARSSDPNSAGSQFFIMVKKTPSLDGQYTVFGKVVEGMDVVDEIVKTPTSGGNGLVVDKTPAVIKSVKIETWPLKKD